MRATAIRFVAINYSFVTESRFPKNAGLCIVAPSGSNKSRVMKSLSTNNLSPGLIYDRIAHYSKIATSSMLPS